MLPTGGKAILLSLIITALYVFGRRTYFLIRLIKTGKPEDRFDHLGHRLKHALGQVFAGRCTLRSVARGDYAGVGHFCLLYAFFLFLISYVFDIGEAFSAKLSPAILGAAFNNFFFLFLDTAALIVIAAIIWAAIRRYVVKPHRLEPSLDAGVILMLIFSLMLLHFLVEGFRILIEARPFAGWSFAGKAFSNLFVYLQLNDHTGILFWTLWWFHLALLLSFLVYIPYSKHLHILASHFNIFFYRKGFAGALESIEDLGCGRSFGVSKVNDFSWKQLLDLYACTECGRCQDACPAHLSAKPLSPKRLVKDLKKHLLHAAPRLLSTLPGGELEPLIPTGAGEDEVWACTTCLACLKECPVSVEPMRIITDLRRGLVLTDSKIPSEIERAYRNLEWFGDPLAMGKITRDELVQTAQIERTGSDDPVDFLLWVGCQGYFHERNRKSVIALIRLFKKLDLKFSVLGRQERCCGDLARRTGNEYLFKRIAEENIAFLDQKGFTKIVTSCPHCFNAFKNEYPQFGGKFQVSHSVTVLNELIDKCRLNPFNGDNAPRITVHDPCYLSRYNGIFSEIRSLLKAVPGVSIAEMARSKEETFCCGAGGGGMWLGRQAGNRINEMRAEEALKTNADYIATSCPYCLIMLEDGLKAVSKNRTLETVDIVELVDRAMS
jgi:Fe-S oxidoreductase